MSAATYLPRAYYLMAAVYADAEEAERIADLIYVECGLRPVSPCETCEGEGALSRHGSEIQCYRCDANGYLTDETEPRHCLYCSEGDPAELESTERGLVCADWQCREALADRRRALAEYDLTGGV